MGFQEISEGFKGSKGPSRVSLVVREGYLDEDRRGISGGYHTVSGESQGITGVFQRKSKALQRVSIAFQEVTVPVDLRGMLGGIRWLLVARGFRYLKLSRAFQWVPGGLEGLGEVSGRFR